MMTDDEYREYLDALARRHLKPGWLRRFSPGGAAEHLTYAIEHLSSTARFVRLVADRPDNASLLKELVQEINNAYVEHIFNAMEYSGVLAALDEDPETTFPNLRRSVIPEEDAYLLRYAGVEDADAEMTILIHYARNHVGRQDSSPSSIAHEAQTELKHAAARVEQLALALASQPDAQPAPKKRKLFNGIGKILAGTVTAAGNLLLATGTVIAPNPATAYGVIGSSAMAIGGVFQGIGDLRGV
jgi:hypothetical protein